uniref:Uncharacterized protein n=1 Tax=Myoviridae sp. ctshb19 TaxID=2825194 RepID=A0A8S5UGE8_9CAUD|nr:MAG TPA: hypothetical protein [Myoviridae sp. ctshb19]
MEPNMSVSRLNMLYTALGIQLRDLRNEFSMLVTGCVVPNEAPVGSHKNSETAIQEILDIRHKILDLQRSIIEVRLERHSNLVRAAETDPIFVVAEIAAQSGLNGYIPEHAEELADKDALYRVCHDTQTEDGYLLGRSVIRDHLPYDRAMEMGRQMADMLGLKESLVHGTWMTCMPTEIEETIVVEKS